MKQNSLALDIAYVAVFTALVIALAFVSIPVGTAGVPIVLQNAALILAGLVLGGRRGLFVGLLFLTLGIAFPVLSGGRTVLAALAGPTVGYIVGYIISPFIAGLIAYLSPRDKKGMVAIFALAGLAGLGIQYACGVIGLILSAGMEMKAAILAQGPFIGFDLLKLAVMVVIAIAVHTAFPELLRKSGKKTQVKRNYA